MRNCLDQSHTGKRWISEIQGNFGENFDTWFNKVMFNFLTFQDCCQNSSCGFVMLLGFGTAKSFGKSEIKVCQRENL